VPEKHFNNYNMRGEYTMNYEVLDIVLEYLNNGTIDEDYLYRLKFTNESVDFADWNLNVVDIRNISTSIQESSSENLKLYKSKDLYPVYIVLSFTQTTFGYIERFLEKVKYSHSGIATDCSLSSIYTYAFNKNTNGFSTESVKKYVNFCKDSIICVLAVFVDGDTKSKINETLDDFKKNKGKSRYGFGNLANVLMHKEKKSKNLSLICSEFVDVVLKSAGINITGKSSNLVIPENFKRNNPKVYKVYEGLARKYNEEQVESDIAALLSKSNVINAAK
jgi:hypothetical protein